jgi:hypothetical protein
MKLARAHLLLGVHAGKTSLVATLASLASNVFNLLVRAVAEVSGVRVRGHLEIGSENSTNVVIGD